MGLFDAFKKHAKPAAPTAVSAVTDEGAVAAPATGTVVAMADLPDPVFAGGAMGTATGVKPSSGEVYAPISGELVAAMPHAFGINGDKVQVLVHVGVDTVEMKGDGFTVHAQKGSQVKAGDPLVSVDLAKVAKAGHPDVVITVVTNTEDITDEGGSVEQAADSNAVIEAGQKLMQVK